TRLASPAPSQAIFPAPSQSFHQGRPRPVGAVMRKSQAPCEMNGDIVACGIAHPAWEARRDWREEGFRRQRTRLLDDPVLVPGEPRVTVHAAELEGHP